MRKFPFSERKVGYRTFLREFRDSVKTAELIWHRDREHRVVEVLKSDNWYLQLDNELPVLLETGKRYEIPKMKYHRLIKGKGDLLIKLYKGM
jgi:hypothetical protein